MGTESITDSALGMRMAHAALHIRRMFPDNGGLRGADIDAAKSLGVDSQIAYDIHVGAGGGVEMAQGIRS